jgi:enoyl-CoA hydratase
VDLDAYAHFGRLKFDRPQAGVLRIIISSPLKMNVMDAQLHRELSIVWAVADADKATSAILIASDSQAFSAGGDLNHQRAVMASHELQKTLFKESRDLIHGMLNCSKPIVSAVNGWAVGAGLACALLADISIVAKSAKLSDGHIKIGLPAGDHAPIIWPLLCGLAKAKYYLLLGEPISGLEAERIGLVSMAVDDEELQSTALEVVGRLANSSASAVGWTKHALNHWVRQAGPIFESALALELFAMQGRDAGEGLAAFLEKRPPVFSKDE